MPGERTVSVMHLRCGLTPTCAIWTRPKMMMEEQNCFKCCLRTVALQQAEQQRAALRLSADASTDMQPGVNFVFLLLGYHKVS